MVNIKKSPYYIANRFSANEILNPDFESIAWERARSYVIFLTMQPEMAKVIVPVT